MKTLSQYFHLGSHLSFQAGQNITTSDDKGHSEDIYILSKGTCALLTQSPKGAEKVYAYYSGLRIIGFAPFLFQESHSSTVIWSSFTIQARTPVEVYRLSQTAFKTLLTDTLFLSLVAETLVENNIQLIQHFKSLVEEPVTLRFSRFVLEQTQLDNGRLALPPFFKYQEIADYLSIHPVTVAKLVKVLCSQGILKKSGQRIFLINKQKLLTILEEQNDFPY
ncbi:Crp/Fnr family transcriptional regulator [Streptococcus moroccensis]|uniref:CRP-like cAMP-binding protein n=1 Tax=Streptococcus moroccensis TaxID=1451356 RepID=A0ABT9YRT4_9STRE|nr:Crp/Fnr family transcriptional regulator [Streptococcus moroccensis]MDQ0222322.1 CRP-like cAMP-binding protein [Streptococcus moroccensis]